MPPISWTSKWRWPSARLPASRVSAKDSYRRSSSDSPFRCALAQRRVALAELVVRLELELGLEGVDQLDVPLERLELLRTRRRGARGPESTYQGNGSKGPGRSRAPRDALYAACCCAAALCASRRAAALVAVLLHLAREVVRHEVQRVPHVARALARSQRHALEPQRALGHLLAPRLLPELDGQLRQGRDLPRHLPQLLLDSREKLFVRACAASTLQLDAHLPSWTLGHLMIGLTLPSFPGATPDRLANTSDDLDRARGPQRGRAGGERGAGGDHVVDEQHARRRGARAARSRPAGPARRSRAVAARPEWRPARPRRGSRRPRGRPACRAPPRSARPG